MIEKENTLQLLEELTLLMHPDLGVDNHTNNLIKVLFTEKAKLASRDYFDLGKYYDRMVSLIQTRIEEKKRWKYMSAVITMKHRCYGAYQVSAIL